MTLVAIIKLPNFPVSLDGRIMYYEMVECVFWALCWPPEH